MCLRLPRRNQNQRSHVLTSSPSIRPPIISPASYTHPLPLTLVIHSFSARPDEHLRTARNTLAERLDLAQPLPIATMPLAF